MSTLYSFCDKAIIAAETKQQSLNDFYFYGSKAHLNHDIIDLGITCNIFIICDFSHLRT